MLEGVLSRLGEYGNPVPRYTAPRCLLERQAVGGCDACHATCPHEAIEFGPLGQSIQIDPQACTGCGLCVQVCPSGALEYDLTAPLQSVRDAGQAGEASLTCSQSGAGGPTLPCLGRVTPALVSVAGAWDTPLTLLHGECRTCPVGAPDVPERLRRVVGEAQTLRAATGQPAQVTVREAGPEDRDRAVRVSRRGAFASLLRTGRQQVAQVIPERPLPFVDWSQPEERTPEEWRWRARSLVPAPPPEAGIHWPAPLVDDTCIDCPVCANVCPTQAITRELKPEGGVQLLLNLSACTSCMACLRSCPPQAIHMQEEWLPAAFHHPILIRDSDSVM
ncbi:4Fe-4S dicluster domain-containing protein [Deinococcus metallilatus]|uniref:4Fe-4S dicluster domain-containing protein n=1 Tax=Deinococcus metallilatus TaxID=1211322 RepID=A0AAJ5F273_9DEIO|nr:4Fe-4S dicluster domain-containing protein [Deinococcus metallilatus]MBB5296986.1 ferredoxin [Deinococcus metallilatus]QBY07876.1 4Fe-4S dicluster domain-containing protein [Deinococcus metallilatus]RXJ13225.1 4Fe-4S dicluster domain-containing protein [Deinococcus metallilatus]TLK23002.1 4Fe-4S dicluster domain-containing protein [Deinococcus metallilatus]GMA15952.1 polyferredoxin [Deinococcus metallilatus]